MDVTPAACQTSPGRGIVRSKPPILVMLPLAGNGVGDHRRAVAVATSEPEEYRRQCSIHERLFATRTFIGDQGV
jgi:hypothetical protein